MFVWDENFQIRKNFRGKSNGFIETSNLGSQNDGEKKIHTTIVANHSVRKLPVGGGGKCPFVPSSIESRGVNRIG